jgi:hypothetical protein
MKLYVGKNPNDVVEIKEDRSAYVYAASVLGLFVLSAGLVALVLFF